MRERKALLCVLLTLLLAGALAGCKKKAPATTPEVPATPAGERQPPPPPPVAPKETFPTEPFKEPEGTTDEMLDEWNRSGVLKTVYFSYDSSDLSESAKQTLQRNAEWLKAHADTKVVVQGHCDERGTIEYNVALGERRAASVRDYLSTLGVGRPRIRIVTYGEERPVDPGHSEGAWTKNRRGEFVLER